MRATLSIFALAVVAGCGPGNTTTSDADFGVNGGDMTVLANGCPPLTATVTTPDGVAGGDTCASYAQSFFAMYCTRCHSSTLTGSMRNGAPDGYNWDDETAVHTRISQIRTAVGVGNFMPPSDPKPACDERRRIVRWIDADAP